MPQYPVDSPKSKFVRTIDAGPQSKEAERQRFFVLATQLAASDDSTDRQRIKEELAFMTFGGSQG
jgi:hypothetical protein